MNDLCKGCSFSTVPNASSVVTLSSPTSRRAIEHVLVSFPPTITAQAPHCPRPQPNFGPFNPRSFRSTYNSGVSGAASTTCSSLFTSIRYDILAPTKLESVPSETAEKDNLPANCDDRFVK